MERRNVATLQSGVDEQQRPTRPVITLTTCGDDVLLIVFGEIDGFSAPYLGFRLQQALDLGARRVVVDAGELRFIDSAGLRALAETARSLRAARGVLVLVDPRPSLVRLLDLLDLRPLFELERTDFGAALSN